MWRVILITFAVLGWGFYELSDGADYTPRAGSLQAEAHKIFKQPEIQQTVLKTAPQPEPRPEPEAVVTRASLSLTDVPKISVTLPTVAAPAGVKPNFEAAKIRPDAPAEDIAPEPQKDLRQIAKNSVNMRMGPGTNFSIVTKLRQGTDVEVLQDPGEGWLKLRVLASGRVGWMADYLVTAAAD